MSPPAGSSVGSRGFYLLREIAALDNRCVIVTSDSNVLAKTPQLRGKMLDQQIDGMHIRWLCTLKFKKTKSLRRILSWLDFELKFFLFGSKGLPKPDAVIVSSLSLLTILNGFLLRRKYGCKVIFEIRDIWPLTLTAEGKYSKLNPLIIILSFIEFIGYKYCDEIVGTMPNLQQHVDKVLNYKRHVHCIPIGFDTDAYKYLNQKRPSDVIPKIPKGKFLIGYIGSIGVSNALDQLFQAAQQTIDEEQIHYLIVGTGDLEHSYKLKYQNQSNVTFHPKISKEQVPQVLEKCDVLYFATHPSEVWNYGQSLNKLVEYMLAGKPVIGSYTGYQSMLNEANCGVFIPSGDVNALVAQIVAFSKFQKTELSRMGDRGKSWINQHRTYRKLGLQYLNEVLLK
ncbi:MAG: hypothetical protein CMM15_06340 [Rhodospirillaceae bacterium]|nr:hypothetical protein [Rhodospirillaceae bacterium]